MLLDKVTISPRVVMVWETRCGFSSVSRDRRGPGPAPAADVGGARSPVTGALVSPPRRYPTNLSEPDKSERDGS